MYPVLKSNLGRRILLLVGMSTFLMLGALVVSGWLAVRHSSELILHERQAVAEASRNYLDYVLRQNLERLGGVGFAPGVDLEDGNPDPERAALHEAYLGSIFDEGIYIADQSGTVRWIEPSRPDFIGTNIGDYPFIRTGLSTGRPAISDIITLEPTGEKVVLMISSLRNRAGKIVGLTVGQVSTSGRVLTEFPRLVDLGERSYIDVIDGNGIVLASSDPHRILMSNQEITRQAGPEVTAFDQLTLAAWSVVVRQSESAALAPVRTMEQRFIFFGFSSLALALFLGWGMARSLIKPIGQLNSAAQSISKGDLSQPIPQLGGDELGELGRSLDLMRVALKRSLDEIQQLNRNLEAKVIERTRQLEDSYRELGRKEAARGELLRKLLSAQEEERKRIARELHDETTQSLTGLVMRLEAATGMVDDAAPRIRGLLVDVKNLALRSIDSLHQIIFNLRPAVLDDLGLLPALRWYADHRLRELGIKLRVEVTGEERRLPPQFETALFRVVQEAITNIARHAEARNVVLSVEYADSILTIEIEDDGKGFDVEAIRLQSDGGRGLGLMGMEERITLLGGKLHIESQPGRGTHITVEVPIH